MVIVKNLNGKVFGVLKKGGVVAYPTDTAYGLGVICNDFKTVKKIYKIKGRRKNQPISVIVSSLRQARKIGQFSQAALKLWRAFVPGPLTLVVPLTAVTKKNSVWQILGAGTIGLRMPDHKLPLKIVSNLSVPLTTTSANISGWPTTYSALEVWQQFKDKKFKPDIIIDGGKLTPGRISTVVDCTGDEIKILRQGSISKKKVFQAVK